VQGIYPRIKISLINGTGMSHMIVVARCSSASSAYPSPADASREP
jgi:hypothetical protein